MPLESVASNDESHFDAMDSGDETSLTEIAPPVLQNLGREISWIDATAGVAIVTEIADVDRFEDGYIRADTSLHISLREICCYNDDCRAASHPEIIAHGGVSTPRACRYALHTRSRKTVHAVDYLGRMGTAWTRPGGHCGGKRPRKVSRWPSWPTASMAIMSWNDIPNSEVCTGTYLATRN